MEKQNRALQMFVFLRKGKETPFLVSNKRKKRKKHLSVLRIWR